MSDSIHFAEALAAIPDKYAQPAAETLALLPKPTRKDAQKGKCDVCGGWHGLPAVHLSYMGHAEITLALIDIDPLWTWEPLTDDRGLPLITRESNRLVMWAHLTVLGKTIMGVGTCEASKGDPEKELIGDFLRNAAMRFGIGTKLWSKATAADPAGRADDDERFEQRPGDEMAARVKQAIDDDPSIVQALKEADTERRGFSGEALDDPAWREQVGRILSDWYVAEAMVEPGK